MKEINFEIINDFGILRTCPYRATNLKFNREIRYDSFMTNPANLQNILVTSLHLEVPFFDVVIIRRRVQE